MPAAAFAGTLANPYPWAKYRVITDPAHSEAEPPPVADQTPPRGAGLDMPTGVGQFGVVSTIGVLHIQQAHRGPSWSLCR